MERGRETEQRKRIAYMHMDMKKIILALLTASIIISSCDILDKYPHDAVSRDSVSEEDLELLYTGLYCYSQYKPGFEGYFQNDMTGGDFFRGGGSVWPDAPSWIKDFFLPTNGWIQVPYTGYYALLYQINSFIEVAEKAAQTDKVRQMLGVAYYFRALDYYNIVTKYRIAPLMRVTSNDPQPNSTEEALWAFVNEDLEKALAMCPEYSTKYYVSLQAAKALAARAYIAQGKKAEAVKLADELIADPLFALDDFSKIFRGEANSEVIFTFANLPEENGIKFAGEFLQPATIYVPVPEVIALFTDNDKRKSISITVDGSETVLNKYINKSSSDPIIISRLAEMYLISAEGKGLAGGGLARLNELRRARGLQDLSPAPKNEEEFIDAILAERRLEFLGEGFRWYDLVRTGRYMKKTGLPEKYTVFPIPQKQLDLNTVNLHQNELWK